MKILSWNVNGLRAVAKKGFLDWVKKSNADIICLQETKAQEKAITLEEKYLRKALLALKQLPGNKYRQLLKDLACFFIKRKQ